MKEELKSNSQNIFSTFVVAVGAAVGTLISETICYPLDTVNTWVKTWPGKERIPQIIHQNIKTDGYRVFLKGSNTQFIVAFVPSFLYFFSYEVGNMYSRKYLEYLHQERYSHLTPLLTATLAEFIALTVLVPMDALKKRYQVNSELYQYKSISHGLSEMVRKEGYMRLFKASPLYLVHATVFNTILFQTYETLRIGQMKRENKEGKDLTIMDSIISSSKAALLATLLTNPLDVIITKYQVIDSSVSKLSAKQLFIDTYRRDGLRGLNRGVTVKCLYRVIDTCIYMPIYEEFRKRFGSDFARSTD